MSEIRQRAVGFYPPLQRTGCACLLLRVSEETSPEQEAPLTADQLFPPLEGVRGRLGLMDRASWSVLGGDLSGLFTELGGVVSASELLSSSGPVAKEK